MSDPPDKLNAGALNPPGGSATNTSKVGAASTATPAPATKSTDEPSSAASKPKTSRNVELKAKLDAAQHEAAELKSQLLKAEQTIEGLRNPPPAVIAWLVTTAQSRFQYLDELQSKASDLFDQAAAVDRESEEARAKLDTERQAWDAQMRITTDVAQLHGISLTTAVKDLSTTARTVMEAEVQRLLTHCLRNSDVVKETAAAEVARVLADRKVKAQREKASVDESLKLREDRIKHQEETIIEWYKMVADFDVEVEEYRRKVLVSIGKVAPPDERRYALSDPAVKDLLDEKWLAGYLELAMAFELRLAYKNKVEGVDYKKVQYLSDTKNPMNPYQIGIRIGQTFGWRAICQAFDRREWDCSLDKREWTWQQFWTLHEEFLQGSTWDGIRAGFGIAEKDFEAKQAQEEEKTSFQTVRKGKHQETGAKPKKSPNDRKNIQRKADKLRDEAYIAAQGTGRASGQGSSVEKAKPQRLSQRDKRELVEVKMTTASPKPSSQAATTSSHQHGPSKVILEPEPVFGYFPPCPSPVPASESSEDKDVERAVPDTRHKTVFEDLSDSDAADPVRVRELHARSQLHGAPFELGESSRSTRLGSHSALLTGDSSRGSSFVGGSASRSTFKVPFRHRTTRALSLESLPELDRRDEDDVYRWGDEPKRSETEW